MAIRVLPPEVSSKIAAGEVVENPASVVKELVENALDAGATAITVELRGGGVQHLRVVDNGSGIPKEEVELAFQRHATSKIHQVADLDFLSTLGFRGEALASIAAVAEVSLASRPSDQDVGMEVQLRDGEVISRSSRGCPVGTVVVVKGLFSRVPARRRFLKSLHAEGGRVQAVLERLALGFPEVQFNLWHEGRLALATPGNGALRDVLAQVYDAKMASAVLEVEGESGIGGVTYRVWGLITPPSVSRANRAGIHFYVNRRWIQSPLLSVALQQAYQGFLPIGRQPIAMINLQLPAQEVDVNVHPTKREVRFRQENEVFSVVQKAVREALTSLAPVPPFGETVAAGKPSVEGSPLFTQRSFEGPLAEGEAAAPLHPRQALPSLQVLGQVDGCYIVAQGADGMYLIDQHAAHERVLFDRICAEAEGVEAQRQGLLEPVAVQLSPSQDVLVREKGELLARYGFTVELFGDLTYLVRAVPAPLRERSGRSLVEVLELIEGEGRLVDWDSRVAASIACHGAVRAGTSLTKEEMAGLVGELERTSRPHTCPHGRPTMMHLSSSRLAQEFGRR